MICSFSVVSCFKSKYLLVPVPFVKFFGLTSEVNAIAFIAFFTAFTLRAESCSTFIAFRHKNHSPCFGHKRSVVSDSLENNRQRREKACNQGSSRSQECCSSQFLQITVSEVGFSSFKYHSSSRTFHRTC